MDSFIEAALKYVGGATVLGGLAFLVARGLASHFMTRDLEHHKSKLTAENALAAERLRADFGRAAVEHETRYRRVDEKVADRLDQTYQKLLNLYEGVSKLVAVLEWSGGPSKDELWERCQKANAEFKGYFYPNRCYIPPAIYKHIRSLDNTLVNIAGEFWAGVVQSRESGEPYDKNFWWNAFQAAKKDADPLFATMVQVVQLRLSVEDTDAELALLKTLPPIKADTGEKK